MRDWDLSKLEEKLKASGLPRYWRSLEELSNTEEFQDFLHREFPEEASVFEEPISRRRFLQIMGASLAYAGLAACTKMPVGAIVPYVKKPEDLVPGIAVYFSTTLGFGGFGRGVLVKSHMGRPTKIEGNPDHPYSLGASDVFMQAAILGLYDPDRSQALTKNGQITDWQVFKSDAVVKLQNILASAPQGVRLLTRSTSSPTLLAQIQSLISKHPGLQWHVHDADGSSHHETSSQNLFGRSVIAHYDFHQADVVLSLGDDFAGPGPFQVRYTRDFTDGRRVRREKAEANRLYVVESTFTNTGTLADHRLPMDRPEMEALAAALALELGVASGYVVTSLDSKQRKWVKTVAADLKRHAGRSLICVGNTQSPEMQTLVFAMNEALGNVGKTLTYRKNPTRPESLKVSSLEDLSADILKGQVQALIMIDVNPVYDAPGKLNFAEALAKVPLRVHMGLYEDETSEVSHWHIPKLHDLESWGDMRAPDGTASLQQPLLEPLYAGQSAHDLLDALLQNMPRKPRDVVRSYWQTQAPLAAFDDYWNRCLSDGVIAHTAFGSESVKLKGNSGEAARKLASSKTSGSPLLIVENDPCVWDGSLANNGWLQELPKPVSKLVWDNAAYLSPALADKLKLGTEDEIELNVGGRKVKAGVWIQPGQGTNTVLVHLGYGRKAGGVVAEGPGFNAYALLDSTSANSSDSLQLSKTGGRYALATTQQHFSLEGRDLVRETTLADFRKPHEAAEEKLPNLLPEYDYSKGYAWGMVIDQNMCSGCNACVVACQSENNIPIVGKPQVQNGRQMHWLRITRYYTGDIHDAEVLFQPLACVHCEKAPCETVCPVGATVHDSEGINDMVYNRCIGTRYCSNNCPYKVRRFNFLQYNDYEKPTLKMMRNPDVTVRSRGVMEKCTYCIQRINGARTTATLESRGIRDGDVRTACQQACPSGAIVFGNINDKKAQVSLLKEEPHNHGLLSELGTQPRTSYLSRVKNPNPELS